MQEVVTVNLPFTILTGTDKNGNPYYRYRILVSQKGAKLEEFLDPMYAEYIVEHYAK